MKPSQIQVGKTYRAFMPKIRQRRVIRISSGIVYFVYLTNGEESAFGDECISRFAAWAKEEL